MKFYRIKALLLKYYYISVNRLDRIFDIFYWPILDLLAWGFATVFIKDLSGFNIMSIILGGVMLFTFTWRSAQDITVYLLEDFWSRNLYNLFTSPVKVSEISVSTIILGFIRSVITFIYLAILAAIIYSFNIFTINIFFLIIFISVLTLFSWVLGLFISSMIYRYGSRIQVFAWSMVWIFQPFSCVFYPLEILPTWAKSIAIILPTTHIFEAMRAVLYNNPINWLSILYSVIGTIFLLLLVSLFLKSSIKNAIKKGLFTRYD